MGQRAPLTRTSSRIGVVGGASLNAYLIWPLASLRSSSQRALSGVRSGLKYTRRRAKAATSGPFSPSAILWVCQFQSGLTVSNCSTLQPSRSHDGRAAHALGQTFRVQAISCLLYTSPSPRDGLLSR